MTPDGGADSHTDAHKQWWDVMVQLRRFRSCRINIL